MKILNKIFRYFFPREFTHNPEDFILKNKSTWYGNKYRYIYYSGNKGESWEKIYKCKEPLFSFGENILNYNYTFEPLIFNAEDESFSFFKRRFPNLQSVLDFEKEEMERFENGKKRIQKKREEYRERLNKNINF